MATTDAARIDLARRALDEAHRAAGLARKPVERQDALISTGIDSLDEALGGGLARGSLYALAGEPGSGRASVAIEWLLRASLSAREPVAFIDGADALDPDSVPELLRPRMLWVRARSALEALSCAEQVLDAGGFGDELLLSQRGRGRLHQCARQGVKHLRLEIPAVPVKLDRLLVRGQQVDQPALLQQPPHQ